MAMKKSKYPAPPKSSGKASAMKPAPKNSTGKDQAIRVGVGSKNKRTDYPKGYSASMKKEYDKAGAEFGYSRAGGSNRNPRARFSDSSDGILPYYGVQSGKDKAKKVIAGNDLAGRRGTSAVGPNPMSSNPKVGSVRGRTTQREMDQAKRRKSANAKKVAKGKK